MFLKNNVLKEIDLHFCTYIWRIEDLVFQVSAAVRAGFLRVKKILHFFPNFSGVLVLIFKEKILHFF